MKFRPHASGHYPRAERIDLPEDDPVERKMQEALTGATESGWRGWCQCGWRGPIRQAKATADNDALRHRVRRTPSPS